MIEVQYTKGSEINKRKHIEYGALPYNLIDNNYRTIINTQHVEIWMLRYHNIHATQLVLR